MPRAYRWLSLLMVAIGLLLVALPAAAQDASSRPVLVGHINGIINPVQAAYVSRVLDEAERESAAAVVFTMDTPGGLSDAMRDINLRILSAKVPVLVYVAPDGARAGSAGVYICYAADLVGMAPATNIGSATPISLDQNGAEAQMSPEMRNKVTNDAVAQIAALAQQRGRNADFAEKAVREGANLQASEALQQGVVNYIAPTLDSLLTQADGARVQTAAGPVTLHTRGSQVQAADMSDFESFLLTVTNPSIAYILLSLGTLGLLLEFYNPGSVFPGVLGALCLLLAFYALGTLPLNAAGVAFFALGVLLFGLEPFVAAHGILAFGGAIAFAFGSALLINTPSDQSFLRIPIPLIVLVTAIFFGFFLFLVSAVVRVRRRPPITGLQTVLGAMGVARSPLRPGTTGLVFVQGELWRAVSATPVAEGEPVRVEAVSGLELLVQPGLPAAGV